MLTQVRQREPVAFQAQTYRGLGRWRDAPLDLIGPTSCGGAADSLPTSARSSRSCSTCSPISTSDAGAWPHGSWRQTGCWTARPRQRSWRIGTRKTACSRLLRTMRSRCARSRPSTVRLLRRRPQRASSSEMRLRFAPRWSLVLCLRAPAPQCCPPIAPLFTVQFVVDLRSMLFVVASGFSRLRLAYVRVVREDLLSGDAGPSTGADVADRYPRAPDGECATENPGVDGESGIAADRAGGHDRLSTAQRAWGRLNLRQTATERCQFRAT